MNGRILFLMCIFCAAVSGCQVGHISIQQPGRTDALDLSGQWQFWIDQDYKAGKEPGTIKLPGSMAQNGLGDDVTVDTAWTGGIVDKSWFTEDRYEKYRQEGNVKVPFWLTPVKYYVGKAWYCREIDVPEKWADKDLTLYLGRCHWKSTLFIDGKEIGSRESLAVPQRYQLGQLEPGKHKIAICVDNSLQHEIGINSHSVSDHTQGNWNGIVGRIELQARDKVTIGDLQIYPDVEKKSVKLKIQIENPAGFFGDAELLVQARPLFDSMFINPVLRIKVGISGKSQETVLNYSMGQYCRLWDEFNPGCYELIVKLSTETGRATAAKIFGMRQFKAEGRQFTVNGRKTFLRGTLDCCIYPLTGYAPMDVESWRKVFKAVKDHGLNHVRYHSWCPPEAAFVAADMMGVYLQVECGSWANSGTTIGDGRSIDKFIYEESERIVKEYGNHPSFCMLAYGNEPAGKNHKKFLGEFENYWKEKDDRRVYTSAAGWPVIPENQYHNIPQPRIQAWGQGLNSRINAEPPETMTNYDSVINRYDVPVVSHEIGQWCVYPNLKERVKYTGVMRAYNFDIFADSLEENGMIDLADDFLIASGKLQALCYKEDIESALRTGEMGGFQLLDLHDFPGQGTALVGLLDPFWEYKGYITAEEYHRFACEVVPLLCMERRVWLNNETFKGTVKIASYSDRDFRDPRIKWKVIGSDGKVIDQYDLKTDSINVGLNELSEISYPLKSFEKAREFSVEVAIEGTEYKNSWNIWVYPEKVDAAVGDVYVTRKFDEKAEKILSEGRKVLLVPLDGAVDSDVPAGFSSIFWNTAWTRRQAPHTLGILCDPGHPALRDFPTEYHSNWQWWYAITNCRVMNLNSLTSELKPIVRVIDDWVTNRRLGLIFEAKVNGGSLLVCSIDILEDRNPVTKQLYCSLLDYIKGADFKPTQKLKIEDIQKLFKPVPKIVELGAKVIRVDSFAEGYPGKNAIDGNFDTIWHTAWEPQRVPYPHELVIELDKPAEIEGVMYMPRQDMSNGWISEYEIYVDSPADSYSIPVARGVFTADTKVKKVMFDKPKTGKYIRFVAVKGFEGKPYAAIAELELIVK